MHYCLRMLRLRSGPVCEWRSTFFFFLLFSLNAFRRRRRASSWYLTRDWGDSRSFSSSFFHSFTMEKICSLEQIQHIRFNWIVGVCMCGCTVHASWAGEHWRTSACIWNKLQNGRRQLKSRFFICIHAFYTLFDCVRLIAIVLSSYCKWFCRENYVYIESLHEMNEE